MPATGSSRCSMPGRKRPTVPGRQCIARVHREHRRGFGRTVAFQDAHAEAVGEQTPGLLPDPLGAGEDVAHGAEIVRMRIARPAVQERVGAEADRRIGIVDQRRHDAVVQRGG